MKTFSQLRKIISEKFMDIDSLRHAKVEEKPVENYKGNYKELRILYYLSKIVISAPLKPEGFGRIVSESLAIKKVILAYNYGGVKDQLNSLNNLYKVEPLDKKELIQKINISSQINEEKYENISNESRSHVIKFFSKDQMLSKYLDLYLNL